MRVAVLLLVAAPTAATDARSLHCNAISGSVHEYPTYFTVPESCYNCLCSAGGGPIRCSNGLPADAVANEVEVIQLRAGANIGTRTVVLRPGRLSGDNVEEGLTLGRTTDSEAVWQIGDQVRFSFLTSCADAATPVVPHLLIAASPAVSPVSAIPGGGSSSEEERRPNELGSSSIQSTDAEHPGKKSVGGDPFVVDPDGQKVQFFLPLQQDVLLLACERFQLYGRAFGTGRVNDHQQWFNRFHLNIDGQTVLVMSVDKNVTDISKKDVTESHLTILKVEAGISGDVVRNTGAVSLDEGLLLAVWKTASGEVVQVSTRENIVLQFKSAVAQKFSEKRRQQLFTHMDLRFVELSEKKCTGGVLAEIWGAAPMTQTTANMLVPPQVDDNIVAEEDVVS